MDLGRPAYRCGGVGHAGLFEAPLLRKWLGGITEFFIDKGYVSEDELVAWAAELTESSASAVGDPAIDDQVREWFVIPEWHTGTEAFTVERLMDLVGTESMTGVALAGPGT